MKGVKASLYFFLSISLSLGLLFTAVELVAFNKNHYINSFHKYGVLETTGLDANTLELVIEDLLNYLGDNREVLDTTMEVEGQVRSAFGEKERLHMIDVKMLFKKGHLIRNISIVVFVLCTSIVLLWDRHRKKNFSRVLIYTVIFNLSLLLILALLMKIDFYKYFTYFHLMFFNNELWILDPSKDLLIQMLPEAFFYSSALKIISYFIGSLFIVGVLGWYLMNKK